MNAVFFQAGGPVMWPLLFCSAISLTFILERFWFWLRLDIDRDTRTIEAILASAVTETPVTPNSGKQGLVIQMLMAGLGKSGIACTKAMETVAMVSIRSMRRGMTVLDTIITVAPMLGILGTVLGIITSFDMLGQASIEDPKAVVAGIAEALLTTACGLGISIFTVFPYNYFRSRIEDAQDSLDAYGTRLEAILTGRKDGVGE